MSRLASLVGLTERGTGVGKLGWHKILWDLTGKIIFFFLFCVTKEKRKIS